MGENYAQIKVKLFGIIAKMIYILKNHTLLFFAVSFFNSLSKEKYCKHKMYTLFLNLGHPEC